MKKERKGPDWVPYAFLGVMILFYGWFVYEVWDFKNLFTSEDHFWSCLGHFFVIPLWFLGMVMFLPLMELLMTIISVSLRVIKRFFRPRNRRCPDHSTASSKSSLTVKTT
jgi:hypothetical protein